MIKYVFLLLLLAPGIAFATAVDFSTSWEDRTVGELLNDGTCGPPDRPWYVTYQKCSDCNTTVQDDSNYKFGEYISPRYGDKYIAIECLYSGVWSESGEATRNYINFSGWREYQSGGSCTGGMRDNDGTEYWIGWSQYIPSNYEGDIFQTSTVTLVTDHSDTVKATTFKIRYAGEYRVQDPGRDHWGIIMEGNDGRNFINKKDLGLWKEDRGKWVDFVMQVRLYEQSVADTSNAILRIYKEGEVWFERVGRYNTADGANNRLTFKIYDWWYKDGNSSTGTRWPDTPTLRAAYYDEIKIKEQIGGSGNSDYCDVTPTIIPSKTNISYPTNNSTSIPTNPTIRYNEYTDNRNDPQNCFSRASTHIQIDEQGENWSTPVYENTNAGNSTQEITGLSNNTHYQMRIRHKSIRQGSTEVYEGDWSDTVSFTTQTGSTSIRADVDQQNGINSTDAMLTLRNSLSLDMSQTAWQESATTGDVNCDGTSNSTDAMLILRHSVGLSMSGTGWCI